MSYHHEVRIVRKSGIIKKCFSSWDSINHCASPYGQVDEYCRKAIAMPMTLRVEITETDTQLYAYAPDKRSYQRAVILKDGRAWQCYGHGAHAMWLHDGDLHSFKIA